MRLISVKGIMSVLALIAGLMIANISGPATAAHADPCQPIGSNNIVEIADGTTYVLDTVLATGSPPGGACPGSGGFNSTQPTSWDVWGPTGSTPITTRAACTIPRPNGTAAAINAMLGNPSCIDTVGAARGPTSNDVDHLGNPLLFIPYAEDELRYAFASPTSNAVTTLTAAQLKVIYTTTGIAWNDLRIGGTSSDPIRKLIPQAGTATRAFFEGAIGISDAQLAADSITVQEGSTQGIAGNPDAIEPFSVGLFTESGGTGRLNIQLNTAGFDAFHALYHVVMIDPATFTVPVRLQQLVGDGGTPNSGWLCSAAAQAIVVNQGFHSLPDHTSSTCGVAEQF